MFNIRMGIPEMKEFWDSITKKIKENTATKNERVVFKKLVSCLQRLQANPHYPSLKSHEIDDLTRRYGMKVWESYLENKKSGAMRIFWAYGPNQHDITIIGLEPHPNDKKDAYDKIVLSAMKKR